MKVKLEKKWQGTTFGENVEGKRLPDHDYFEYEGDGAPFYRCSCGALGRSYLEVQGFCQRFQAIEQAKSGTFVVLPDAGYIRTVADASDFPWPVMPERKD